MDSPKLIRKNDWELPDISISHRVLEAVEPTNINSEDQNELVRMHFGLRGSYSFQCHEIPCQYALSGHHNNIMYTPKFNIQVTTESSQIETFGINFTPSAFIQISQNGPESLKMFSNGILAKKPSLLNSSWKFNTIRIQHVIGEIINCTFSSELQQLFLQAKAIELLVLQADLHERKQETLFIKSKLDQKKIILAKDILSDSFATPPSITQLAQMVATNEYKLKKGFREIFSTSIFSYILQCRMKLALRLLIDTEQQIKNIAEHVGYSTPQHFSAAFKKHYGASPKMVRKTPDLAIKHSI